MNWKQPRTRLRKRGLLPAAAAVVATGAMLLLLPVAAIAQAPVNGVQATTVPLLLSGGLAYDSLGNLYTAATNDHVVRVVSPTGFMASGPWLR